MTITNIFYVEKCPLVTVSIEAEEFMLLLQTAKDTRCLIFVLNLT